MSRHFKRKGFTLVELLVVITIIGVLVGMLLPAVQMAREAARRMQCANNLKQAGLALAQYEEAHKVYPFRQGGTSTGTVNNQSSISGWLLMLPYFEQQALADRIKSESTGLQGPPPGTTTFTPWSQQLVMLLCPSDGAADSGDADFGHTSYVFSVGDSWARNNGTGVAADLALASKPRGMFGHNSRIKASDLLKDGLSNTLAFSERVFGEDGQVTLGGVATGVKLSVPQDCLNQVDPTDRGRFLAATSTANWSGRRWHDGRPGYVSFTTALGPNSVSCTSGTTPADRGIYSASSYHPGSIVCLFADGAVKTISDSIDTGNHNLAPTTSLSGNLKRTGVPANTNPYGVWGALGTRKGKETVSIP